MLQYEVAFQNGLDCGGGYVKLLSSAKDLDLRQLTDKTPYTIMFGPELDFKQQHFQILARRYISSGRKIYIFWLEDIYLICH